MSNASRMRRRRTTHRRAHRLICRRASNKGFVVLKDIRGVAQFLLIPTARIGGIEDPAILAPDATNYWDAAWRARDFVDGRLHTDAATG